MTSPADVDVHALSGAYALDAVDDLERAAFERHLRVCPACSDEVRELRATVARLADDAATTPPPNLRASVLSEVSRTAQVRSSRPPRDQASAVTRWRRWTAAAVAAGIIAVGIGAGTWAVAQTRVSDAKAAVAAEQRRLADVRAILAAPDARVMKTTGRDGGSITIVVSVIEDGAVAVLDEMPAVGEKKTYQLWMISENTSTAPNDVGTLVGDGIKAIHGIGDAASFGVSVEPEGGSKEPTPGQIIGLIALST